MDEPKQLDPVQRALWIVLWVSLILLVLTLLSMLFVWVYDRFKLGDKIERVRSYFRNHEYYQPKVKPKKKNYCDPRPRGKPGS